MRLVVGTAIPVLDIHFNPRTREGCDAETAGTSKADQYFNPRTREGCDGRGMAVKPEYFEISIHAPVKGATKAGKQLKDLVNGFQSTHP